MISETHEKLGELVAAVYKKVDWKKQTSLKRSAVDILTDRLRAASHEPDVIRAFEKLCASLHIPNAKVDAELLTGLYYQKETMEILREQTGYIALLGQKKAKELKHEN